MLDWMLSKKNDNNIEKCEQDKKVETIINQDEQDALRRKMAFEKLTKGDSHEPNTDMKSNNFVSNESIQGAREVRVFNIRTNQDLNVIVEFINRNKPVIANLAKVPKKEQQRVQDFLSGISFALNANISLLVQDMYLLTPYGIVIKNDSIN